MSVFSTLMRAAARSMVVFAVAFALIGSSASAEERLPTTESGWKQYVNAGTVRIITKGLGCTCSEMASDMAQVLNQMGTVRILPVIGHGSLQGIADVLHLQGIDLSILQSDALAYVIRNNIHRNINNKIRYVMKLHNSEMHLIAGPDIQTIQDLEGRKVSFDVEGSGSAITGQNVFDALGINVEAVHIERDVSIEKIRRGELAAVIVVTGKPAKSVLAVEEGDGLHLIGVPFTDEIQQTYMPSLLKYEDYPNLIAEGQTIETIAVGEVLAVYNWDSGTDRYQKLERFVNDLFDNFDRFREPTRHRKWQEINIATELPGWQRFRPAQEWLDAHPQTIATPVASTDLKDEFQQFLADSGIVAPGDSQAQEALFRAFLEWNETRSQ